MSQPEIVDEIKDALRNCASVLDVEACADKYRAAVKELNVSDHTAALQIINLKDYRIEQLRKDGYEGQLQ